jgi:hypothetical protein
MAFVLAVGAYFPFAWDPPRSVRNDVTRSVDGSLRFGEMNSARTTGTPSWLREVRTSGKAQIQLQVSPQSLQEQASIMMLASDFWHTDFAIGQDHSDVLVWLRRPGSDANGDPPFVIRKALRPQRWNNVTLTLQRENVRIEVNGRAWLTVHLPGDYPQSWGQGLIALGNEVHGGGSWQGEIRLAEVRTTGYAIDYVRPGALSMPQHFLYFPDHFEPFLPTDSGEWLTLLAELLSFVPVGFLIAWSRRPTGHGGSAILLAAGLAIVLGAGKFLFHARHLGVADLLMEVAGAVLGALLAAAASRRREAERAGPAPTWPPEEAAMGRPAQDRRKLSRRPR